MHIYRLDHVAVHKVSSTIEMGLKPKIGIVLFIKKSFLTHYFKFRAFRQIIHQDQVSFVCLHFPTGVVVGSLFHKYVYSNDIQPLYEAIFAGISH